MEVYKGQGGHDDPDGYRGVVLEDHLGKGLKEMIAPGIFPFYNSGMP